MSSSKTPAPSPWLITFHIPDLFSYCQSTNTCHPSRDVVEDASAKWCKDLCSNYTDKMRRTLAGLKPSVLAAYIYHDTDEEHLRVVCDFLNYTWLIDDMSDRQLAKDTAALHVVVANALESPHSYRRRLPDGTELPEQEPDASKLARDFWVRCLRDAKSGFKTRFIQSTLCWLESLSKQAQYRNSGVIPSLGKYIELRRENSGVLPFVDALEYTLRIDLPDHVIEHPIVMILKQCANDFVSWSNDIYSFNVEQSRGDQYNIVAVLIYHNSLDIQGAVDHAAEMCRQTMARFYEDKANLPSWGSGVDEDISRYIQGLESWMSGNLHWSFITERYFGAEALKIKRNRVVRLLPPKRPANNAI